MEFIKKALYELKRFLFIFDLSRFFLHSLLAFFLSLIFLVLFQISWIYALIPFFVTFLFFSYRSFRENRLSYVEYHVPSLSETLRTVSDNVDKDNFVVNLLKSDVLQRLRTLDTSSFATLRSLWFECLALLVFAFTVLLLAFFNVQFDYTFLLPESSSSPVLASPEKVYDLSILYNQGNLSEVLGNRSLAALGDTALFLEVNPLASEIDISEISESNAGDYGDIPQFPKEIYTSYDSSFSDDIPKENKDIVKKYFEGISQR